MQLWNWLGKYHLSSDIRNFISHITYYSLMFFIAYAFKGQVYVNAGWVIIVSHSSCRTSAILKYFCPCLVWASIYLLHFLYIPEAEALTRLHICIDLSESSLIASTISTKFLFAGPCFESTKEYMIWFIWVPITYVLVESFFLITISSNLGLYPENYFLSLQTVQTRMPYCEASYTGLQCLSMHLSTAFPSSKN